MIGFRSATASPLSPCGRGIEGEGFVVAGPAISPCRPNNSLSQIVALARKEARDSFRNRWFLLYSLVFTLLTLALSYLSLRTSGFYGHAGFGRTTAGLVNLVLLVVPLMSLAVGAAAVAGERERGSLEYLLAQPISRLELIMGKYLGSALALLTALAIGFGTSGLVLARQGGTGQVAGYLTLVGATGVLALAMLSVGFLLSVVAARTPVAMGGAILTWFALVFLGDLGLMGGALAFSLRIQTMFGLALLNPTQVFKMAVLTSVHASLDVLGPVGLYASRTWGAGLPLLFAAAACAWIVLPLAAACVLFVRRGEP